jgi:ribonucleotide monophosphatase NagD (HAD superfamily)
MTGRVRALLIDLNGTLHIGEAAIEGAGRAVERLLASGIPMRFVTNTTTQSRYACDRKLQIALYVCVEVCVCMRVCV